jgi:hypothetical protein
MTTAFQYVFDNAESIGFNRRAVTAQTISRNNTVRTVSRGGQVWRFDVKLPDGIRWSDAREYIEAIDSADRFTTGTVQINNPGYNTWLLPYLGTAANPAGIAASWTQGASTITLTSGQAAAGLNFGRGDVIQLGTGRVYSVTADVPFNVNTVPVNRAIIDANGSGTLKVGSAVTWSVVCTELPQWTIFARDQVSWSGPFVFYEVML